MNLRKIASSVLLFLIILLHSASSFGQNLSRTFPSGSAIIDMGSATPTVANSLKPYGLVYMMLKDRNVPVYWSINQNKPKGGIDFSYNGKDYKGGVFIVSKEFFRASVVSMLNNYAAQGVIIDYTTTSLTLDNLTKLSFGPNWTMDKTNGVIGVGYLNAAGIPSSAFSFKEPSQLNSCDDIFVLPHADPTWEIHNNLYFWNKNNRGNIWVGCNAVSILEGLSKDTTILGVPSTIKLNFLSTNGLVTYFNHQRAIAPFQEQSPSDYLSQYIGKTDAAQQNGAEGIYLPKIGSTWNASTKIITSAQTHSDIPSLSAGPAVKNIYGRAFNDATRGYVAYQASHNMGGTAADNVNAQRIFLNFSFFSLGEKAAQSVSNEMTGYTTEMKAGQTYNGFNGTATGNGGPFTYQWLVSIGGTFSSPNSAITSYTPDPTITTTTTGVLSCIATDACGRKSITSIGITILKGNPPLIANNIAKDVSGDCPVNTTSFNVFDSNVDAEAGARTLTAVTFNSGTRTFSSDGTINYTSAENFFGSVTGTYTISNGTVSTTGNITLTVGLTSLAPSVTNDAITVLQDKVTEINVLGNDKNNPSAGNGNVLYIKDISQKPSKGYVYINSNGTVSYVSQKGDNTNSVNFKYLACNDVGYCSEAQVDVAITLHGCSTGNYKATTDVAAVTGVLTFVPSKDSYISSDAGFLLNGTFSVLEQTNFGSENSMIVNMTANQDDIKAPLMHFDLSALPISTTINSAQFSITAATSFTVNDATDNIFPVTLTRLKKPWTETGATWEKYDATNLWTDLTAQANGVIYNNPNTLDGTDFMGANIVGGSLTPTTVDPTISVSNGTTVAQNSSIGTVVTNLVKYWTANPANNFGLVMTGSLDGNITTNKNASFYTKEGAGSNSQKPTLIVNYNVTDAVIATCVVVPSNYKPVAYPDAATTNSNADVLIDVLNNDANYYSQTNNLAISLQPRNGTATISTNKISYHPNGSYVGIDTLVYQITDATNGQTNTAVVRVNVKRVPPTIVGDLTTTASGTAVTITVTANDTDPQGAMNAPVITVNPKNGSAVVVGNDIVYTPSVGFTGTDVLTYSRSSVSNSICVTALSASAQVTITVTNRPPVANNEAVSTFSCAPIEIKVLTNDTDPEATPLTPSIISTTSNGTLTITANNTLLYTPNNGFAGSDQFTYKVSDAASLLSAVAATVSITVSGVANDNISPVAVSDNESTLINQSLNSDVLLNDSDPNGDNLTISIAAGGLLQPANGTITLLGNNMIRYTPNANFVGTDSYEYQICDSHPGCGGNTSLCAKGLVTIKVAAIPIQVSGTIWDDADGSAAGTFNNIQNGAEFGTNAFGGVYVYLVDNTNTIIDQTSVDNNGAYMLVNVPPNTANLKMILSSRSLSTGDVLSSGSLPSGFTNTSPITKTFTTTNTNITGSDFGIGQLPVANSYTFPIQLNTNPGSLTLDPTKFSGTDPDGTIDNIKFTSFPTNITSITLNGNTYTSGTWPGAGVTLVATSNALTGVGTVSIIPVAGSLTPVLSFIVIDNSGAVSPLTGTVNVPLYVPLTAGVIASNYTFCGNGIPSTFTSTTDAAGGRATINYQWEMSSVVGFGTLTSISGANSSTYTHSTSITATTYFRRKVSTTADADIYSNILTVTINPLPAAPSVTGATSNTSPSALTLSSTANGATGDETVDWFADPTGGTALQLGATGQLTRTFTTPGLTNTTNYYPQTRNVTTGCISLTRTIVTGTISGTLNPGVIGSDQSGCGTFTPAGLTSSVDAIGLPSITYQWQSSTVADFSSAVTTIGGATASTYSPTSISTTTYYRRVATSGVTSKNSNIVTVTSNPLPTAPSGAALNGSRTGSGTVTLTGTVASGVIIDWYNNTSGNGLLLAGSNIYTTPVISQTTNYYPLARNIVTGCLSARATAIATINPVLTGGIVAAISPSVCGDATPSAFTSSTNPSGGTGTYIYQWQSSTESSSSGFVDIAGANASTYTPAAPITTTTYYRRGVSTASDLVVYSNVVTITRYTLPVITTTPTNSTISSGTSVTINASGADTYIWSPATSLTTTNTAAVTSTPLSTITYTVTGTSTNGCISSTTMVISVINAGTITGTQTNCGPFTPTTFTSNADASGGAPITYQWQSSTTSDFSSSITTIAGATASTYSPGLLNATTYFRRVATFNGSSFNSNILTATVNAKPTPTISSNSPVCVNGTLSLSSSGGGTYSWSGPNGFTSATQNPSINNVTTAAGGTYSLTVTGANGCTAFTTTTVTVNALPTIAITPNAATITLSQTASLTASGAGTYSWSPSTGLPATNTATVTAGPLSSTTAYTVTGTVTATGCINTGTVTVTIAIINPGVIGSDQANCGAFTPTAFTETTPASGATPITYQWQSSTDNITYSNIVGATATTYTPGLVSATTHYRRVATYNGANFNSNSIAATVNPFPTITVAKNNPLCVNGTLSLSSTGGGTYSWSGPNGFASTLQNPSIPALTTAASGLYTLTVTGTGGCITSTSTSVTVNTLPIVAVTPTAITINAGFSTTLTASGANTYSWTPSTGLSATNTAAVVASPIVTTTYAVTGTNTATGCTASAISTVTIKNLIDAVDDDYTGTEINGAKGGLTPVVITNDKLNNAAFNISVVNLTLVSNGGLTGLTFSSTGELIIPAKTTEGTYSVTYSICEKANPTNCDQAIVLIKVGRGLTLTATAVCKNDVPYVQYKVEANFVAGVNPVTLTWLNSDKTVVTAKPIASNQPAEAEVLWAGAVVDANGNGTDWPGWYLDNGQWIQGADGFEKTRPTAYLVMSVNPTDTIAISYPPATPACNAQPPTIVTTILNPGSIGSNQTICLGSTPAAFTSTANASGGTGTITYQWQSSTDSVTFTNITGATSSNYSAGALSQKTYFRRAAITTVNGTVFSNIVSVTTVNPPVIAGINGPCAMPKDSTKTFSVAAAVPTATGYVWTIPAGYTGASTTNSINIKAGTTNGVVSVYPVNGACIGNTVTYNVSIIDYAQVTITGLPVTAAGTNNNPINVTVQLFDVNGNKINCSGGVATLCSNYGTFTPVIDKGDGTYTSQLTGSANDVIICGSVGGVPVQKTTKVTFTGPQGSIKGNGPILATETPKLTFTMTEGRAPFTIIYRSAKSNKNDTLTNYTSGTAVNVPLIPTTTLYTMVSIIDANLERRDNNFTRDTATIIVVAPKVVITLRADPAVPEKDSTWSTRLTVKTKNIGDLDLSNSQAQLNLKDVFPNPVTFVLDSVTWSGRTITPNRNYDGRTNNDLFARVNQRSDKIPVNVYSNNDALSYTVNASSGMAIDGETNGRANIADRWIDNATGETVSDENIAYDEHSLYLFGPLSALPVGVEADMVLYLHIKPNGYKEPFVMQAVALGTGSTQGATALATSLSNDNNDISTHPEVTKVGDPAPAVVNLFPLAVIGSSLSASTPVLQPNGTYNVTLSYLLKNHGNLNLLTVGLLHNLARNIGSPSTFNVVGPLVATGNLIPNQAYDGKLDTNILKPNTILSVNTEGAVKFTINITPNQLSSLYRLQATATGFSNDLNTTVTDLTTDGLSTDPDGNNIPDEKVLTIITINQPIPPLVIGKIGILIDPVTRATVPTKAYCATATGVAIVSNESTSGGSGPYEYQWQSSADNVVFTNIPNATDSIYTTGTFSTSLYFRKRIVSDNQIGYTNAVFVQINNVTKPVISASGPLALPQNGNVTLTSTIANSYSWSNGATTQSILVTVATVGSYKLSTTDANGCVAESDPVRVTPPPPITINATYIVGASTNPPNSGIQVTGFPGAQLNYYTLSAGGVLIPVPVLPSVIGVFTYYVSQTINGMESVLVPYTVTMLDPLKVADIQKLVSNAPELQADGSFIMGFKFLASNLRPELLDSVKIKDDLTKVFPITTEYSLLDINASGRLRANPLFNGNSQQELLADGSQLPGLQQDSVTVLLKVVPNGFSGQLNNTAIQTAKSPFGTFTVTSNDPSVGNGFLVRNPTKFIIPFVDIFIPSGFSPNRDGVNDKFVITRPFNTTINLQLFNRWGNAVYLSPDYKNDWDGRGNQPNNILGEELPDGTYYYIVTATNRSNGTIRKFAAFITLKR